MQRLTLMSLCSSSAVCMYFSALNTCMQQAFCHHHVRMVASSELHAAQHRSFPETICTLPSRGAHDLIRSCCGMQGTILKESESLGS